MGSSSAASAAGPQTRRQGGDVYWWPQARVQCVRGERGMIWGCVQVAALRGWCWMWLKLKTSKPKSSEPILCPLHAVLILPEPSCLGIDIRHPTGILPFPAIIVLSYHRVPPRTTLGPDQDGASVPRIAKERGRSTAVSEALFAPPRP